MTAFLVFWLWIWGGVAYGYILATNGRLSTPRLLWMMILWPALFPVYTTFAGIALCRKIRP